MRIPGAGDLAPARRRGYGGSYGRRRRQRNLRLGLAVLLVAAVGGGVYVLRRDDTTAPARIAAVTPTPCATRLPSPPAAGQVLPATTAVRLAVLNGTPRAGLAKTVADQLAAQGFVVTGQGNSPKPLAGGSTVVFGTGGQPAAALVSRWVQGSRLVGDPKAARGSVQLVLGSSYQRLSTPAEVAAAGRAPAAAPSAVPTPCT